MDMIESSGDEEYNSENENSSDRSESESDAKVESKKQELQECITPISLKQKHPSKYLSAIYDHYYRNAGDDGQTYRCIECNSKIQKGHGGQTNLKKHLKRKHPESFRKLTKSNTGTLEGFFKRPASQGVDNTPDDPHTSMRPEYYKQDSEQYKKCKRALAEMICSDIQPTSIVNDPGFLNYSETLNPKFVVPSRDSMNNEIDKLYEERRRATEWKIRHDIDWYCITFDIWTARTLDSYISLTVHYIHKHDWTLQDLRLGAYPFPGQHNADELANKIKELLREWDLPIENLVCITCDNASNNVKCVHEHFDVLRAPCAGHVLNLAISDGLKVRGVAEVVARCRKLVEHFSRSRAANEELKKTQILLKLKRHKLIQDVPTRWNSTYLMLERLQEQKQAVVQVVKKTLPHANAPLPSYMPSNGEWKTVERLIPILVPFYDATVWISASSYVTISALGPTMAELKKALHIQVDDPTEIRRLKEAARIKLDKYFSSDKEEDFLDQCTYLDPRFREFPHKLEAKRGVEDKLIECLTEHISQDMSKIAMLQVQQRPGSNSDTNRNEKQVIGLGRLLATMITPVQPDRRESQTAREIAILEIQRYNALPRASIDTHPLDWWKYHHSSLKYVKTCHEVHVCSGDKCSQRMPVFCCWQHCVCKTVKTYT